MLAQARATFWEWLTHKYPPKFFKYNWQGYFVSFTAAAGNNNQPGLLSIQQPLFVFDFRSRAFDLGTGVPVAFPYAIGIAMASGDNWSNGQWFSEVITGDIRQVSNSPNPIYEFPWPREIPPTTQLTITVDNSVASLAANATVQAGLTGIEVRKRALPFGQTTHTR